MPCSKPESASVDLTHSNPAGSRVWHVMGMQRSVPQCPIRQGWGGPPVRQWQAQGILIGGARDAGDALPVP
jgi:hypothetical protein